MVLWADALISTKKEKVHDGKVGENALLCATNRLLLILLSQEPAECYILQIRSVAL